MKITFTIDTNINECDPELIRKLLNATTSDEVHELEEEYCLNEVADAIFALADEKGIYNKNLIEERITDWLWDEYYEHCQEYVIDAFVQANNEEKSK